MLPIDSTEPVDAIDSTLSCDHSDQREARCEDAGDGGEPGMVIASACQPPPELRTTSIPDTGDAARAPGTLSITVTHRNQLIIDRTKAAAALAVADATLAVIKMFRPPEWTECPVIVLNFTLALATVCDSAKTACHLFLQLGCFVIVKSPAVT
jgi:hypothetical protein